MKDLDTASRWAGLALPHPGALLFPAGHVAAHSSPGWPGLRPADPGCCCLPAGWDTEKSEAPTRICVEMVLFGGVWTFPRKESGVQLLSFPERDGGHFWKKLTPDLGPSQPRDAFLHTARPSTVTHSGLGIKDGVNNELDKSDTQAGQEVLYGGSKNS